MRLLLFATMVMVYCALDNMDCEEMWKTLEAAQVKFSWWLIGFKIRRKIYMENRDYIAKHSHLLRPPHMSYHNYFLKMNNFGDLLHSCCSCYHGPKDDRVSWASK